MKINIKRLLIFSFLLVILVFILFIIVLKNKENTKDKIITNKNIINSEIEENKVPEMFFDNFSTTIYKYENNDVVKNIVISGIKAVKYRKKNGIEIEKGKVEYYKNNKLVQTIVGDEVVIDDINNVSSIEFLGNSKAFDIENNFSITADKIILNIKDNIFTANDNVTFNKEEDISGKAQQIYYYQNDNKIILKNNASINYYSNYAEGKSITILNFENSNYNNSIHNNPAQDKDKNENNKFDENNKNLLKNQSSNLTLYINQGLIKYKENGNTLTANGVQLEFINNKNTRSLKVYNGKVEYQSVDNVYKTIHTSNGEFLYYLIEENLKNNIKQNKNNSSNKDNKSTNIKQNKNIIDSSNSNTKLTYTFKNAENIIKRVNLKDNTEIENIYFKSKNGKIKNNKNVNLTGSSLIIDYINFTSIYGEELDYDNDTKIANGKKNIVIFLFKNGGKENFNNAGKKNVINEDVNNNFNNKNNKNSSRNNIEDLNAIYNTMNKLKNFNYDDFNKNKNEYIKNNYDYSFFDKIIMGEYGKVNTDTKESEIEDDVIIKDFSNVMLLNCDKLIYSGQKDDYYVLSGNIKTKQFENIENLIENQNPDLYLIGGKAKIYNKTKYGLITESPRLLNTKDNYFISSDIIEVYFNTETYLFKNNVLFIYNKFEKNNKEIKTVAKGTFATFNNKTNILEIKGDGFVSINGSESYSNDIKIDVINHKVYLQQVVNVKILEF